MRNTSGLKRTAGPGRPKGGKNKRTKEMEALWREFFESEGYIDAAKHRVAQGKAPHLENYWLQKLNGKPTEHVELEADLNIRTTVVHELHPES